jgi:DNA-binding HxlR family transcriptional regulator
MIMSVVKHDAIPKALKEHKDIVFVVNILTRKWSLFILLSLKEPKRFNQLRRYLDISHSVLAKGLKNLEILQLINRKVIEGTNPPSVEYSLTEYGRQLLTICEQMEEFGSVVSRIVIEKYGMPEED